MSKSPKRIRPAAGFTLVELLVVVAIIVLLVGILVPIVPAVLRDAEAVRSKARIIALQSGCSAYKTETGYYPGQLHIDRLGTNETNKFTGSQYLALSLYEDGYVDYSTDDAITIDGQKAGGASIALQNSVSDRFSDALAVLYFPAKLGVATVDQYDVDHNIEYIRGNGNPSQFASFIKDGRFTGNRPYN
ncbi:hypothetical protein LCGC14_1472190, partial [marine sediment metagenome]